MGGDKRFSKALKIITVGLLALLVAPILFLISSAASKNEVTYSAVISKSSHHNNITSTSRSHHGYIRPHPPFPSLQRTSHTCRIIITNENVTEEEEIVHIPTAVPHLIVIGAQKSATSEFQAVANRRKNVITPLSMKKFEPHFLDWNGAALLRLKKQIKTAADNAAENTTTDTTTQQYSLLLLKQEYESKLCKLRQMYTMYFNMTSVRNNNESIVMEKTPSYILNDKLPQVIDELCPWKPKILAILRNPVDRAYSHYRMSLPGPRAVRRKNKTMASFSTIVKNEIEKFINIGLLDNATLSLDQFTQEQNATSSADTLAASSTPFVFPPNMTLEKSAQILSNLTAKRKANSYLIRGMYAPLLLPWVTEFAVDNRLMVLKFHEMFNNDDDVNVVDEALQFAGLKDTSIDNDEVNLQQQWSRKRTGDANHHANQGKDIGRLDSMTRLYLTLFYRPFNRFLVQLLGDEWEGWGE